jgi:glutamine synthetase type III
MRRPGTSAAEYHMHPKYLIHAAVNRTTLKGTPEGGWFPEQKITVEDALRAYTINGATAAFDAETRGSIKAGKPVFEKDKAFTWEVDDAKALLEARLRALVDAAGKGGGVEVSLGVSESPAVREKVGCEIRAYLAASGFPSARDGWKQACRRLYPSISRRCS